MCIFKSSLLADIMVDVWYYYALPFYSVFYHCSYALCHVGLVDKLIFEDSRIEIVNICFLWSQRENEREYRF